MKISASTNPAVLDLAASFQQAVVDVLVTKTVAAAGKHGVNQILLAGGVAANKLLRETITRRSPIPVLIPAPILCTDNAAMVACCGYFKLLQGKMAGCDLDVVPGLSLGENPKPWPELVAKAKSNVKIQNVLKIRYYVGNRLYVIPAQAGIQATPHQAPGHLDSCFRRSDMNSSSVMKHSRVIFSSFVGAS